MPAIPPTRNETNPFDPPAGPVGRQAGPIPDAEIIRRSFLAHESSVRSLGLLAYLAAALTLSLATLIAAELVGVGPLTFRLPPARSEVAEVGLLSTFLAGLAATFAVLGFGLRRLAPWARWATVATAGVAIASYLARYALAFGLETAFVGRPGQIIGNTLGLIASGSVLVVLLSRRSGRVFGADYRAVVCQTPEISPTVTLTAQVILWSTFGVAGLLLLRSAVGWLLNV